MRIKTAAYAATPLLFVAALFLLASPSCHTVAKAPSVPTLVGPTAGIAGESLAFEIVSEDTAGDTVAFMLNWGDSSSAVWSSFLSNGESLGISHVYAESGDYAVKAKAKNGSGAESDWSGVQQVLVISAGAGYPDSLLWKEPVPDVWKIVVSKDGQYLYLVDDDAGGIAEYRADDGAFVDSVVVGPLASSAALTPDGAELYVGMSFQDSIAVVRTADLALIRKFESHGGMRDLIVSPDGSVLYGIGSTKDSLLIWRTSDDSLVASMSVAAGPEAVALNPKANLLYVSSFIGKSLTTVNTSTNSVSARLDLGDLGSDVCVNLDGSKAYVATMDSGIAVVSSDGSGIERRIRTADNSPADLVMSPDGRYVVCASYELYLQVLSTRLDTVIGTMGSPIFCEFLAMPADGSRIYGGDPTGRICAFGRR